MNQDWRDQAECADTELEVFIPDHSNRYTQARALSICDQCPVLKQCREYAARIEAGQPADLRFGVFGGLTPTQRYQADLTAPHSLPLETDIHGQRRLRLVAS